MDIIGDMLARIKNAQIARHAELSMPHSNQKEAIAMILKNKGYIASYEIEDLDNAKANLVIKLKYFKGKPVIEEIKRVSKPGRRVYTSVEKMPKFKNGLGIVILSTPQGILDDATAREKNCGGEIICFVA